MSDVSTHPFDPDPDLSGYCMCGLPKPNRRHAEPAGALRPVEATIAPLPITMSRETLRAAQRALPGSASVKGRVLAMIAQADPRRGVTDGELGMAMPLVNSNTLRPRRIDLTHEGWLEQVRDEHGQPVVRGGAAAWRLSDAARIARAS